MELAIQAIKIGIIGYKYRTSITVKAYQMRVQIKNENK